MKYLLLLPILLFACQSETNQSEETTEVPEETPTEAPATPVDVDASLVDDFPSIENHDESAYPFKAMDTQFIDLNGDSKLDKITLFRIEDWADPGDFQKIEIELNGETPYEYRNYGGWISFEQASLPTGITAFNKIRSENILLLQAQPETKLIVLFGWPYASDPGLVTIIDPKNKTILFNKNWSLQSITDIDTDYHLELTGTLADNSYPKTIDFSTAPIQLTERE